MKTSSQNDFIDNKIRIMVATSAFGMGVDKKNVGLVVHYEISDSLENYVQELVEPGVTKRSRRIVTSFSTKRIWTSTSIC